MTFKDQFIEDVKVFLNADEFAEEVIYEESGFTKRVNALYNDVISETDASMSTYFSIAFSDVKDLSKKSTITYMDEVYGVISWSKESGIVEILVQRK